MDQDTLWSPTQSWFFSNQNKSNNVLFLLYHSNLQTLTHSYLLKNDTSYIWSIYNYI